MCEAVSVVSDSVRPRGLQPARLLCLWGFSRQEFWSGLPCPPPEGQTVRSLVLLRCPLVFTSKGILCEPHPGFDGSVGGGGGGGGLAAKLCPTLAIPMDCSLPASSVHGFLQARILECVDTSFSGDLPDPEIEPGLLHCRQILYRLSYEGNPGGIRAKAKNKCGVKKWYQYMKTGFCSFCLF